MFRRYLNEYKALDTQEKNPGTADQLAKTEKVLGAGRRSLEQCLIYSHPERKGHVAKAKPNATTRMH